MKNKLLLGLATVIISATLSATANAVSFYDTVGTPFEGAVERLYELDVVSGVSKNTFNATKNVTRAEFAKMIVQSALKPSEYKALISDDAQMYKFRDIDKSAWYYDYVTCAVNGNFMSGYDDGLFRPNQEISYAEISKMVTKALGHTYIEPNDPRGWEAKYVDKMYEYDLFGGTVGIDSMFDKASRGNVAIIIWNMLTTDTWKMIYRNDLNGFTYIDSGSTLMEQKIVNHTYLLDAKVNGFTEINGQLHVILNNRPYKMFDQNMDMYFSMIGGTTDVLLKRVEYPGKKVMYEAIGLSTDTGSKLITGTIDQVKAEGYDLSNRTKLSKEADYYYVYTNETDSSKDRVISVNLSNMYLIDSIKVTDEKEKADKDEDKSHSEVPKNFEDDIIAYRYKTRYEVLTRSIDVNDQELVIGDGAVVFKDNKRILWSAVKKGDTLVEITKDKYYFVVTTTSKTVRLEGYNTKKDEYTIQTSAGELKTYKETLYYDYLGNKAKHFNALQDKILQTIVGKNIEVYLDQSGKVVKIELLEDEIKLEDLKIGIYDEFIFLDKNVEYNEAVFYMDGKRKTYRTKLKAPKVDKGDLVSIKFDKDSTSLVASFTKIGNNLKITDNLAVKSYNFEDLKKKIKYYDEDKVVITRIKYNYNFGQYDEPKGYEIKQISINEFVETEDSKNITVYALVDKNDGVFQVFMQDYTAKNTKYYGLIKRIYKYDKKNYIQLMQVTGGKVEYELSGKCDAEEGDFIVYEASGKNSIIVGEKYTTHVLGYFKDLIVKSKDVDKRNKITIYELNDGELDTSKLTIETEKEVYDLNDYDMFLLKLGTNTKTGEVEFSKVELIKTSSINLEVGDRIAINEIEGTAIVYRGYEE